MKRRSPFRLLLAGLVLISGYSVMFGLFAISGLLGILCFVMAPVYLMTVPALLSATHEAAVRLSRPVERKPRVAWAPLGNVPPRAEAQAA